MSEMIFKQGKVGAFPPSGEFGGHPLERFKKIALTSCNMRHFENVFYDILKGFFPLKLWK